MEITYNDYEMMTKTTLYDIMKLNSEIMTKYKELGDLQQERESIEINHDDYTQKFREHLDETNDIINIEGIHFNPSLILEQLDPIAFDQELKNYVNIFINVEETNEYEFITEEIYDIKEHINELKDEIKSKISEILGNEDCVTEFDNNAPSIFKILDSYYD